MKHPFTLAPLLLPLVLLLALTGCNTTSKEGATPGARIRDPNAPNAQILFNQVVFLDPTLTDFEGDGKPGCPPHPNQQFGGIRGLPQPHQL